MNIKNFVLTIFFLNTILGCQYLWGKLNMKAFDEKINFEQAKNIAEQELKKRGYNIENMDAKANAKNNYWQEIVSRDPSFLERPIIKRMNLKEKEFWALYFYPKKMMLGGDAWIFVDKKDGNVLGVVLGE